MSHKRIRLILPLLLSLGLTLSCSQLPGGQSAPTPTAGAVLSGATATAAATRTQAVATSTPAATQSPAVTATPVSAEGAGGTTITPAPSGEALPRLEAGEALTVTTINMLSETAGWGIGRGTSDPHDHVLRTTDGGSTWQDVSPPERLASPEGELAATGFFQDADNAWVTYAARNGELLSVAAAVVWRTRDAGLTWSSSQPLNLADVEGSFPSDLFMADGLHGWLLTHVGAGMNHDYVILFATGDGGQTWARVADPLSTDPNQLQQSCGKTGLGFLNAQTGWVTGDCHGVAPGVYLYRADDGGHAWQPVTLPAPANAAGLFTQETMGCGSYPVAFLSPQTVRLAVYCQDFNLNQAKVYLYASDDAGQSWQISPLPGRDSAFLDAQTGWSVAEGDVNNPRAARKLSMTADGGRTWTDLGTVTWSSRLDFVSPLLGWGVARAGDEVALVHTTDGGKTWKLMQPRAG